MNIIWTGQARHTYDTVIAYLLDEWTVKEAQEFVDSVKEMERQIKKFPSSAPISDTKRYLRKAVLGKHNSLVYQIDGNDIIFVTFINNQQNHDY